MKIIGIKLWIDTEIHPDNIGEETYEAIANLPHLDETDTFGETTLVGLYLSRPDQIDAAVQSLKETLNVLL